MFFGVLVTVRLMYPHGPLFVYSPVLLKQTSPSQMACFSEDLKCWEAWDTTCGHKAKDITPLIASLDNLPCKDATREGHRQSDEHWNRFKGNIEETSETRCSAYGLFRVHRYHLELNGTELSLSHDLHTPLFSFPTPPPFSLSLSPSSLSLTI